MLIQTKYSSGCCVGENVLQQKMEKNENEDIQVTSQHQAHIEAEKHSSPPVPRPPLYTTVVTTVSILKM